MKNVQKMVMITEHLLQSMETEYRLTAPAQLTTLTRLDQDMKQIMDSSLPDDQKVLLLDQLLQRYQGLTKQMKSEVSVKPTCTVVIPKPDPAPPTESTSKVNNHLSKSELQSTVKAPIQLPRTPVTLKLTIKNPCQNGNTPSVLPEESSHAIMMETKPDSKRKPVKWRRKPKTPLVAKPRSNRHWEPY